ncbi:MAG TPA: YihY/virulence factor BrkB family protein [Steroidobacteraceae bacterium]|nr:YihY/virulence factor BrkB family protein [Steroidobacteraceae bacterium]
MSHVAPTSAHPGPYWHFGDIVEIVTKSVSAWFDHNASSLGAALAFYTLFSVAPILIIAVAIAGYVFGADTAQTQVLSQLQALIGNAGAAAIRELLSSAHYSDKKGLAAAVGVVTLVVGATSVFGELQNALERIWQTPRPTEDVGWWRFIRGRVLSVGMVFGVGFLLLVSLVASAALAAFGGWLGTFLPQLEIVLPVLDVVFSLGMTVLLFALIYKYVPRESVPWGDVWIGATVTALLFTIGKSLIGLYLGKSSFSSAYGAAGSLIVLLLWIYYSAQIFLLGAEFTHVFAYQYGSRSGDR